MIKSTEVTNKKQDPLRSQERLQRQDKKYDDHLPYADLTGNILACCFEVMKELGIGFLESIYKNLVLQIKSFGVYF